MASGTLYHVKSLIDKDWDKYYLDEYMVANDKYLDIWWIIMVPRDIHIFATDGQSLVLERFF